MGLVHTTKNQLPIFALTVEVECEHWFVYQTLCNHVLEGGYDVIDRDGRKCKAHDSVEFSCDECDSRFVSHLSKSLVLDGHTTEGEHVFTQEAVARTTAILDGEMSAICGVARRFRRRVLVVQDARDLELALRGGNPQIGGTRVRNDLEGLRGRAELDIDVVLRVHEVVHINWRGCCQTAHSCDLLGQRRVFTHHLGQLLTRGAIQLVKLKAVQLGLLATFFAERHCHTACHQQRRDQQLAEHFCLPASS
mmetsp:Transcript_73106/g.107278  ORF Transcript_73106/g.107278 Transcript_73106/m.107278 type:complete len:250 (+) Transcript_73106:1513-2262(+)